MQKKKEMKEAAYELTQHITCQLWPTQSQAG